MKAPAGIATFAVVGVRLPSTDDRFKFARSIARIRSETRPPRPGSCRRTGTASKTRLFLAVDADHAHTYFRIVRFSCCYSGVGRDGLLLDDQPSSSPGLPHPPTCTTACLFLSHPTCCIHGLTPTSPTPQLQPIHSIRSTQPAPIEYCRLREYVTLSRCATTQQLPKRPLSASVRQRHLLAAELASQPAQKE